MRQRKGTEPKVVASTKITLNKTSITLTVGNTETLSAKVTPTLTWKSDDTSVARVDSTGKVTAINSGRATITVSTSDNVTDTCTVQVSGPTNVLSDDFENGIASFWSKEFASTPYSATISSNYFRNGKSSLRMELRKTDPDINGSKRSELAMGKEKPLEEHWYSCSILLPNGGNEDYALDPNSPESLIQWHNVPDTHLKETWTSPPLSLQTVNGHYYLVRRWDDAAVSTNASMNSKGYYSETDLGPYGPDKGKWVDWKFHIKWGWLKSQNPILEVYKNGVKVYDATGLPNTMNDQSGVYMKVGIYKWDWSGPTSPSRLTKRVVYYDAISIQ